MTNYFIVYRPFHYEYAKKIIIDNFANDKNIIVNHFNVSYVAQSSDKIDSIMNLSTSTFNRASEIRNIKNQLLFLAKSGENVNVLIPHTLGILSNFVFFSLASKYKNIKVNIFYEGLIVFLNYDHEYLKNIGYYLSRWLISAFSGISYRIDKRLINFYDERIYKVYSPFLNLDAPREKIIETKINDIKYIPLNDTCVILGFKLHDKYKSDAVKIIQNIYSKLDEWGVKKIYFKDHPVDKSELFHSIAKEVGKDIIEIKDITPIESIISNYSPKYVISIWSSGIINLSNMLPPTTKIYCFVTQNLVSSKEFVTVMEVFKAQNIEVVYV